MPRVPPCGLSEDSRKKLNHTRECANQILKAAMAINNMTLAEMEVPESYIEALPKVSNVKLFYPKEKTIHHDSNYLCDIVEWKKLRGGFHLSLHDIR